MAGDEGGELEGAADIGDAPASAKAKQAARNVVNRLETRGWAI